MKELLFVCTILLQATPNAGVDGGALKAWATGVIVSSPAECMAASFPDGALEWADLGLLAFRPAKPEDVATLPRANVPGMTRWKR